MAKFEITVAYTYDVSLKDLVDMYGTADLDDALQIDIDNAREDPFLYIDVEEAKVSGRVVDRNI